MAATPRQGPSGRSRVRTHQLSGLPEPLTICLPLDYTAFCLLHRDAYLRYTQPRPADAETSRTVVETTLGQLALNWPAALSTCPAAVAWQLLGRLITLSAGQAAALMGLDEPVVNSGLSAARRRLPAARDGSAHTGPSASGALLRTTGTPTCAGGICRSAGSPLGVLLPPIGAWLCRCCLA